VIRPDSGDPKEVVVKILDTLAKHFPPIINAKGYKQLPPHLRIIQGDGVTHQTVGGILEAMKKAGWSADNILFGTGGALLQKVNRDTQKVAFKCSNIVVDGEDRQVYKDPITDHTKRSKKGRLTLEKCADGGYRTVEGGKGDESKDQLHTVFENGRLLVDWTFDQIRERAEIPIVRDWKVAANDGCP